MANVGDAASSPLQVLQQYQQSGKLQPGGVIPESVYNELKADLLPLGGSTVGKPMLTPGMKSLILNSCNMIGRPLLGQAVVNGWSHAQYSGEAAKAK